jgi:hypothetical protein
MPPVLVCANCGARGAGPGTRACAYCGAAFLDPTTGAEPAPKAAADPAPRFRALRASPAFEAAQRRVPDAAGRGGDLPKQLLSAAFFLTVGLFLFFPALAFPPMAVAVAFVVGLGVWRIVSSALREYGRRQAPLARVPALVVDERMALTGGGDARVRTRYFLALESERGSREEYEVEPSLAGRVVPGEIGVAFFQGDRLIDFEAIPG